MFLQINFYHFTFSVSSHLSLQTVRSPAGAATALCPVVIVAGTGHVSWPLESVRLDNVFPVGMEQTVCKRVSAVLSFHPAIILAQCFFSDSSFFVVPWQIGIEPKMQAGLKAYRMCKWFHLVGCPINIYAKKVLGFALSLSSSGLRHVGSLFTDEDRKRLVHDVFRNIYHIIMPA